jgi:hypothetical protein
MDNFDLRKFITEGTLTKNLSNNFEIGDKVKVNDRERFKELIGLEGTVVDKNPKKTALFIDFGKEINGDGFITHNLGGTLDTNTGLAFYDTGWVDSKIFPRFDIRNLTKI